MLAGLLMLGGAWAAADPAEEGTDYKRLSKPLAVETGAQVEVVEFFWYRCPHCSQLEPGLEAWAKKLPADVKLRPVPAVLNQNWLPAAKIHYALADMGALDRLHGKVFEAYHKENLDLDNEAELLAWVKKQGLDAGKFQAAYRSFSTFTRAKKGDQAARNAGISGVPALLVDGKYLTSISMTYTEERLFEVLDQLIQRARSERGGKSAK
jgi:thiol:disulfide interchange protein DsbA